MAAIVLDHEQPHHEGGRRDREQQGQPIGVLGGKPHPDPEGEKGNAGRQQLGDALLPVRMGEGLEPRRNAARFGRRGLAGRQIRAAGFAERRLSPWRPCRGRSLW